ncbi:MAG: helix-turn-helix transcriptional regulator [Rhizobiaceae bacterium]
MADIDTYDRIVGRIYDCAVDPDLWQPTLTGIRDAVDAVYVSMAQMRFSPARLQAPPGLRTVTTEWDMSWLERLPDFVGRIPQFGAMLGVEIDSPVTQLEMVDEGEFRESDFYRDWLSPQGIRDTCIVNIVRRERNQVVLSAPTSQDRDLYAADDLRLLGALSPHLRRALMISELYEEQGSWIRIHNALLDEFAVPVFLVDPGGRLRYRNAAADRLLEEGVCVTVKGGRLLPTSFAQVAGFDSAIDRACMQDDTLLGLRGNGMVLTDSDGQASAVAYVLPFGRSDRRRELGPGLAAIFIATDGSARRPSAETLSAFSGISIAEARVALGIAAGKNARTVAAGIGISIHTLRTHLAKIYDKTGLHGQVELAAYVNRLSIPLDRN